MTTGTVVVQRALQKIGAHSVAAPASAESIDDGFATLTSMMESWVSMGIQLGFVPLTTVASNLNENADTTNAIIFNLAQLKSLDFPGATPPPDLRSIAASLLGDVKALYQTFDIPDIVVSSTLPVGEGNQTRRNTRTFFGPGGTIGN